MIVIFKCLFTNIWSLIKCSHFTLVVTKGVGLEGAAVL